MNTRTAEVNRVTSESDISVQLMLDGCGNTDISTGIGFLDHMLVAFSLHARIDLSISCKGDLEVDDHHTVEDCGIVLGKAIARALGDRTGIVRFGYAYAALDEALARVVVDISGRPSADVNLGLTREKIGALSCENIPHFFRSVALSAGITLHLDVLKGENDHHRAEAAFKAFALAMREATGRSGYGDIPSTKGTLEGANAEHSAPPNPSTKLDSESKMSGGNCT
ncbi:MAG: imidazoleglycerol-phosphate dehydratase HisB [Rhodothermia bacterium]|nr:MAG: imidazoleglycerol-phosphate dehydratase HisB [Rhodothermia bacterium]